MTSLACQNLSEYKTLLLKMDSDMMSNDRKKPHVKPVTTLIC